MLNIAVIGVGDFGVEHVRLIQSMNGIELFGICDRNNERLNQLKKDCGIPDYKLYTNATELFKNDLLDAVIIATDEKSHESLAREAVSYKKHVLIEKPITTDVETANRLLKLSQESDTVILPGHMLRFDPGYAAIKKKLDDLDSNIHSIRLKRNIPIERFALHSRTHPVYMALSHDIDQLVWNLKVKPKRLYAMQKGIVDEIDMPGIFFGLVEMENGTICSLETQWCLPNEYGQYIDAELEVMFEGGHIRYRSPGDTLSIMSEGIFSKPDIQLNTVVNGEIYGTLKNELEHFVSLIEKPRAHQVVTMEEAVIGIKICDALIESAQKKQEILWENLY